MVSSGNGRPAELRAAPRYAVAVPVEWSGGSGLTRDVSRSGVYFTADRAVAVGDALELRFSLPDPVSEAGVGVRCGGEVLRVERVGDGWGAAVVLSKLAFGR